VGGCHVKEVLHDILASSGAHMRCQVGTGLFNFNVCIYIFLEVIKLHL
jgi:hypothetical protein